MSRIPFAQISGDVVNVAPPAAFDPGIAAQLSGGTALIGAGRGIAAAAEIGEKIVQARDTVNVSNALVDANAELDRFRGDLDRDPDVAGREAKFAAKAEEVKSAAAEKLGRGSAIDNFNIRYNQLSRTMQLQVMHAARDEELQNFRLDLTTGLDKLATQAAFARSDAERQVLQAEADKTITDAVRTGRLTAVGANGLRKAFLGRVDAALAGEMVRTNPGAAIAALGDPEKFKYLDAPARVQLRAQATARSESLGIQARAELRADVGEFVQDVARGMVTGQMPSEQDYKALLARTGPKSALGVRLQRTWDFGTQVADDATGKSIPQLQARVRELQGVTEAAGPPAPPPAYAVTDARLNGGRPTVVPAQWDGQPVDRAGALERAVASAGPYQSFDSEEQAAAAIPALAPAARAASPQDLHKARVLGAALQQRIEARERDPAAYALVTYPTISDTFAKADQMAQGADETAAAAAADVRRRAWSSLIEAQQREGTPDYKVQLLTRPQAEALRANLQTADGQQRVDLVDQLRVQFGEHWPRVQAQLFHDKPAPGDVQVIGALPPGADAPKLDVVEANKISDQQATELLGGKKITEVDDAVRKAVEPMAATMVQVAGGPSFLATYQSQIERVARLYMIRDKLDSATAASRAADRLFFDHWEVIDGVGGATLGVPKRQGVPIVPASAVRDMQRTVMDALPKLDLLDVGGLPDTTAAQRRDMLVQAVRLSGFWIATEDDQGMVLMAGPKRPVLFADGRPLIVPFDSVAALAANKDAKVRLGRRITIGNADNYLIGPDDDPGNERALPAVTVPPLQKSIPLDRLRILRGGAPASPTSGVEP